MAHRFSASVTDSGLRQALAGLSGSARDLSRPMDDIGRMLMSSIDARFERQADPDGRPWAPLKPSTIKDRQRKGYGPREILTRSRRLRQSITREADASSVTVGTHIPYAAIHQFGGEIERGSQTRSILWKSITKTRKDGSTYQREQFSKKKGATRMGLYEVPGHSIAIPARPYMGITAADETEAVSILRAYLLRAVS